VSQFEITAVVVAAMVGVIALRIWRTTRERRMRVSFLWVGPLLVTVAVVYLLILDRLISPLHIALALAVFVLGLGTGLYQGTHTTVRADRAAGFVYVKTKPIGAAIVAVVIAVRVLLRSSSIIPVLQNGGMAAGGVPLPPRGDLLTLTSAMLLVFALGMISGLRIFLYRAYSQAPDARAG
jgi:hypothetical protein